MATTKKPTKARKLSDAEIAFANLRNAVAARVQAQKVAARAAGVRTGRQEQTAAAAAEEAERQAIAVLIKALETEV